MRDKIYVAMSAIILIWLINEAIFDTGNYIAMLGWVSALIAEIKLYKNKDKDLF